MKRLRDNLPSAVTNSTCALFLVRGRGTPLPDTRSVRRAAAAARVVSSVASDIVFPPGRLFTPRPKSRFVSSAHEEDVSPVGTHFAAATGPDRCARKKALLSLLLLLLLLLVSAVSPFLRSQKASIFINGSAAFGFPSCTTAFRSRLYFTVAIFALFYHAVRCAPSWPASARPAERPCSRGPEFQGFCLYIPVPLHYDYRSAVDGAHPRGMLHLTIGTCRGFAEGELGKQRGTTSKPGLVAYKNI